jgi:hypothetical protein
MALLSVGYTSALIAATFLILALLQGISLE